MNSKRQFTDHETALAAKIAVAERRMNQEADRFMETSASVRPAYPAEPPQLQGAAGTAGHGRGYGVVPAGPPSKAAPAAPASTPSAYPPGASQLPAAPGAAGAQTGGNPAAGQVDASTIPLQEFDDSLLRRRPDFMEKSLYQSTYRGGARYSPLLNLYTDTGFDDIRYDYINRNHTALNRQKLQDIQNNTALFGTNSSQLLEMTNEERRIFNYLYATSGHSAAYDYVDTLMKELNRRQRMSIEKEWRKEAQKSPVGTSVFSIITSPMKLFAIAGAAADYVEKGEIDENAGYFKYVFINDAIRDEAEKIAKKNWGTVGSIAYNLGMEAGDFLFSSAVCCGNAPLASALMSSETVVETTLEAKDRGLSDRQAILLGSLAGLTDLIVDKIPLNELLNKTSLSTTAMGHYLAAGIAESGEAVTGDALNFMADILVSQDKSQWNQSIQSYRDMGQDDREAVWSAFWDQVQEVGMDALGGLIAGSVTSAADDFFMVGFQIEDINEKRQIEGKPPIPTKHIDEDRREYYRCLSVLRDKAPQDLASFLELKYDNSRIWKQFQDYQSGVSGKKIPSTVSFDLYKDTVSKIGTSVMGTMTPDGTMIRQTSPQFVYGVVNATADSGGSFSINDIRRALESPYRVEKKWRGKKQMRYCFTGNSCTIEVNPQNGKLLSVVFQPVTSHKSGTHHR